MLNIEQFRMIAVCRMTCYGGRILLWYLDVGKAFVTFKPGTKGSSYV